MSQEEEETVEEKEESEVQWVEVRRRDIPNPLEKLVDDIRTPIGGILSSSLAFLTGIGLLADDAHDFGQFATEDHPSPLHHWQYGIPLILGGVAGLGWNLIRLIKENPPPPKMPDSMVEGMKYKDLERYM